MLLLAATLAGCAYHVQTGPRFAGLEGVEVVIASGLPDSVAAPRSLRPPQLRERLMARMERARVPVIRETRDNTTGRTNLQLELDAMPVGPDDYAVWVRVSLAELIRFDRRSPQPLMVSTWVRSGNARVRGNDTAALWREIERLSGEFAAAYHAANPTPSRATPAAAQR
jgi:hypothetical protein